MQTCMVAWEAHRWAALVAQRSWVLGWCFFLGGAQVGDTCRSACMGAWGVLVFYRDTAHPKVQRS